MELLIPYATEKHGDLCAHLYWFPLLDLLNHLLLVEVIQYEKKITKNLDASDVFLSKVHKLF